MPQSKEDFLKELLNDFKIEASEHLQSVVSGLLELEKNSSSIGKQGLLEHIFRETHSMKGAARAVNLLKIERLCMSLESVFHAIKNNILELKPFMYDVFFQSTDILEALITELSTGQTTVSENTILQLTQQLSSLSDQKNQPGKPPATVTPVVSSFKQVGSTYSATLTEPRTADTDDATIPGPASIGGNKTNNENDTIRVTTSRLLELLQMAEEMTTVRSELEFYSNQVEVLSGQIKECRKQYLEKSAMNCFSDGRTGKDSFGTDQIQRIESDIAKLAKNLDQLERFTGRSVNDIIQSIKHALLQPFSALLMIVPRIVRDLSSEYKKEIELEISGGEIEIDRRILEQMKDPVIHLIRNCIDHGIETPDIRIKKKKPPTGKLRIDVRSNTDHKIQIRVQDDGAGIDMKQVVSSGIKAGMIKPEEVKTVHEKELFKLIFASGVSTSPFITDVSGRGLGMAIVAEKIGGLGGTIEIDTQQGRGTTFTITIPQTLATFRGVLVVASDSTFLIPTTSVLRAISISPDEILTIESKKALKTGNETIGIVRLSDVLNLPKRHIRSRRTTLQGLILQHSTKKMIVIIDEVSGEYQGVVKPPGPLLQHIRNISGVSVLGDGSIVPVLNISELLSSASYKGYSDDNGTTKEKDTTVKQILVAEDSITIRTMLRNYLESAGYGVRTAVDGQEAFEFLQTDSYDILVSDVEMPRMNGFELTARVRKDPVHSHLPVILVTALDSSNDRLRGMEAGANAYIVKSSFEKSNLIETINRLI